MRGGIAGLWQRIWGSEKPPPKKCGNLSRSGQRSEERFLAALGMTEE